MQFSHSPCKHRELKPTSSKKWHGSCQFEYKRSICIRFEKRFYARERWSLATISPRICNTKESKNVDVNFHQLNIMKSVMTISECFALKRSVQFSCWAIELEMEFFARLFVTCPIPRAAADWLQMPILQQKNSQSTVRKWFKTSRRAALCSGPRRPVAAVLITPTYHEFFTLHKITCRSTEMMDIWKNKIFSSVHFC